MPTIEERLARLEKAGEPEAKPKSNFVMPKFDPTAQLCMPASAMQDLIRAVPNAQAIANDHIGKSTSLPTVPSRSPRKATPNWVDERPLPKFGGENFGRRD